MSQEIWPAFPLFPGGFYTHQEQRKGSRKNWPAFPLFSRGFRLESLVFSGGAWSGRHPILLILRRHLGVFPVVWFSLGIPGWRWAQEGVATSHHR